MDGRAILRVSNLELKKSQIRRQAARGPFSFAIGLNRDVIDPRELRRTLLVDLVHADSRFTHGLAAFVGHNPADPDSPLPDSPLPDSRPPGRSR